jgi:hypothetical protein
MTDDNVMGDGPYTIFSEVDEELGSTWWMVRGPGIADPRITATSQHDGAHYAAFLRNDGYGEGFKAGIKAERARCNAIASRDVEVIDQVSGSSFMCKPNCSCAKDIMAGT